MLPPRLIPPGLALHSLLVRGNPAGVRALLEARLGVETEARPMGGEWEILFVAPPDVDVDFLRPDVLPPRRSVLASC